MNIKVYSDSSTITNIDEYLNFFLIKNVKVPDYPDELTAEVYVNFSRKKVHLHNLHNDFRHFYYTHKHINIVNDYLTLYFDSIFLPYKSALAFSSLNLL